LHKSVWRPGSAGTRWAAYSAVPDSLAGLKGKRGRGEQGRERKGREEWEREAEGRKVRKKGGGKEDAIFLLSDFMATPVQQPRTISFCCN